MKPRFCVVSLNPAIDVEWRVDDLRWEEKNLVHSQRRWAGGKGANVARWLNFLGSDCELLIPLGGSTGDELLKYLTADHVRAHVVPVRGETRANVVITAGNGRQMRFNQPGASLTTKDWRSILSRLQKLAKKNVHPIFSGSIAPGLPADTYAKVLRKLRDSGVRTFMDCDGEALKLAVPERPFLVKPNRHELSEWIGRKLSTIESVRDAALKMSRVTGGWVLVSLSGDGALLVNAAEGFGDHVRAGKVKVVNTLGAGDAMLAAAAHAAMSGATPREWLRAAVAAGTAATQCEPGHLISRQKFQNVLIKSFQSRRPTIYRRCQNNRSHPITNLFPQYSNFKEQADDSFLNFTAILREGRRELSRALKVSTRTHAKR